MEGEDQAKKALPIVQSYFKGIDAYEEEIAQDGNIIEVDFEIGLDADEQDDIYSSLGEMPKRVAEAFPDFNFYCIEQTDAYGVAANSEATMKHGEFVCVSGDSDGNLIDGNIVFTEENIDMDEGMQILFEEESWKTGSITPPVFCPYQERCVQNVENLLQAVCGSMVTGLHRSFTSVSETWRFTGCDKYGIIN